jgi:hypothetical protein
LSCVQSPQLARADRIAPLIHRKLLCCIANIGIS